MKPVRLMASVAVTILLLILCAVLAPSAFELSTTGQQSGLGLGALPQFAVVAVSVLSVLALLEDVRVWKRKPADDMPFDRVDEADPRRVVGLGFSVLVLLAIYAVTWAYIGFPAASVVFMAVLSLLLLPRGSWNVKSLLTIAVTAGLFSVGVWALFVHVLLVPLR